MLAVISSTGATSHVFGMFVQIVVFVFGPVILGISVVETIGLRKWRTPMLLAGTGIVAAELLHSLWGINVDEPGMVKHPSFTLNLVLIAALALLLVGTGARLFGILMHRSAHS